MRRLETGEENRRTRGKVGEEQWCYVQRVPGILCLVRADEREQVVVLKEFTSRGVAASNTRGFAYGFK